MFKFSFCSTLCPQKPEKKLSEEQVAGKSYSTSAMVFKLHRICLAYKPIIFITTCPARDKLKRNLLEVAKRAVCWIKTKRKWSFGKWIYNYCFSRAFMKHKSIIKGRTQGNEVSFFYSLCLRERQSKISNNNVIRSHEFPVDTESRNVWSNDEFGRVA